MMRVILLTSLLLSSILIHAQTIKGRVTDQDGKTLPFASIFISGSQSGTHSNNEGKYSLKLQPGHYTLTCQYIGYRKEQKEITVDATDINLDFVLTLQEMTLAEVVVGKGEDPAYEIIRQTIKKRKYHQQQLNVFTCEVYTKGQMKLRDYPDKLLGKKVDFEDGDTSKKKMLYLSETVSRYSVDRPNKEKTEVISSKVSGQRDGFGLSAPGFFSFYDENIFIGNGLNPRGFISPIAGNALNYYKYKLEGTYYEDGREICHIKVIPKRKYEPLFSGYINVIADEWRIHSLNLLLTKESQMQVVDTLRLEQLYRPLNKDVWYISSQVIYPAIKILGFDAYGSFVNIYTQFNIEPAFTKKSFDHTIVTYTDSSNKKSTEYWEKTRPIPLMEEEIVDYRRKDSLEVVRKSPRYLDSLDRVRNKFSISSALLLGQFYVNSKKHSSINIDPALDLVSFNPAEGLVIHPAATWTKRIDTTVSGRKSISITPNLRYGFANGHFNPSLGLVYNFGKKYAQWIRVSGGKNVFQFNNNSPISEKSNTLSCLLGEKNRIRSYEALFFRASYRRGVGSGLTVTTGFQFQDREALDNRTDYTWHDRTTRKYAPNYPEDIMPANIRRHQVSMAAIAITFQPGARYIQLPDRKINIGSKHPVFNLQYTQAFAGLLGSDESFSKWELSITDGINFKMPGKFRYRVGMGGFIEKEHVEVPDYIHFNGNISTLATEYLNSFQLLPIYRYSNTNSFYALLHAEHNFNGFLTNKIPGIRKLNIYLVTAVNGFYLNKDRNYYEWSVGLDNIFRQIRVDFVQSYRDGRRSLAAIRIGITRGTGRGSDWP